MNWNNMSNGTRKTERFSLMDSRRLASTSSAGHREPSTSTRTSSTCWDPQAVRTAWSSPRRSSLTAPLPSLPAWTSTSREEESSFVSASPVPPKTWSEPARNCRDGMRDWRRSKERQTRCKQRRRRSRREGEKGKARKKLHIYYNTVDLLLELQEATKGSFSLPPLPPHHLPQLPAHMHGILRASSLQQLRLLHCRSLHMEPRLHPPPHPRCHRPDRHADPAAHTASLHLLHHEPSQRQHRAADLKGPKLLTLPPLLWQPPDYDVGIPDGVDLEEATVEDHLVEGGEQLVHGARERERRHGG
mmetsp:Transcript_10138/g.33786  ORF Transcript_10138/g.33786 Transcript_10138/m.33786 type:complete len:302 (+) Transcript_10138:1297-2202(+)